MSTLTGNIVSVYQNEKSDKVIVDDKGTSHSVILRKGEGKQLKSGQTVTLSVEEKTFNGKSFLNGSVIAVKGTGSSTGKSSGSTGGKTGGYTHGGDDSTRTESINFQSARRDAIEMLKHNKSLTGEPITEKELLALTYKMARLAIKPELFISKEERDARASAKAGQQPEGDAVEDFVNSVI
jgi:hypothetical protein